MLSQCCIHRPLLRSQGYRMVPQKTWVTENFWPNLKISEAFLMSLRSLIFGQFLHLGVQIFFQWVSESQICPQKSNFSEFMGTCYRTEVVD